MTFDHLLLFIFLTSDCSKFDIIGTYNSSTFQKYDPKLFSYLLEMFSFKSILDCYTSRVWREKTAKNSSSRILPNLSVFVFSEPGWTHRMSRINQHLAVKFRSSIALKCFKLYKMWPNTCLSILLATFNYRARGTCGPSTLNYPLNRAANAW